MKTGITFICFLLTLIACSKPEPKAIDIPEGSIVFSTSLADTLPPGAFKRIGANNVTGVKLIDLAGHDVRYFRYSVNKARLLKGISTSSFSIEALVADTVCRRIERANLACLSTDNDPYVADFLLADEQKSEIYECIKPPLRHLILFREDTEQVLHRIEMIRG